MHNVKAGANAEVSIQVTDAMTASHMGSGKVNAYATPAMIALMERAAVNAIDHLIADGHTSVGTVLEVNHLAPTPPGQKVRARAEVFNVEGNEIIFTVQAWFGDEMIGDGTHSRIIVDVERFSKRLNAK
jgi:fluoroacetyl-CoA thioesterase